MKVSRRALFLLLILFTIFSLKPLELLAGSIYAGASAKIITPDLNKYTIYLAGFGMGRKATGVHDDLWSRSLCLRVGETTLALVSVDLVGVMYPEYIKVLKRLPRDLAIDMVLLTSTHNHEGPDVVGLWGPHIFQTGVNWGWYNEALDIIAKTIAEAYHAMEPAGIRLGHDEAPGLAVDSREPHIMEEQVETLQAVDREGNAIATVVFYASHPEVLWDENTLITSDYPHYLYRYIEENDGGIAIFANGPLGGLISPKVSDHTFEEAQRVGETIADISLRSLEESEVVWETVMRVQGQRLYIPMTNTMLRVANLSGLIDRPLYHCDRDLLTAVGVVELGENGSLAQIVTVPGEDFPENWFEIKGKMHAQHRMHIGLCLDEVGYVVPREDWQWLEYEESMSASIFLDRWLHNNLEKMLTLE